MLETARVSYPVLRDQGWRVYLFEDTQTAFSDFEAGIRERRDRELAKAGVILGRERQVAAVTPDSVVFTDGSRQPVGFVVNSCFMLPRAVIDDQTVNWPPETEADLRLRGWPHIWATTALPPAVANGQPRRYLTTADWMDLGKAAGQNAWAASQDFETRPFHYRKRWILPFSMGRRSLCQVVGWVVGGLPAWFLARISNLATMPGLERNLRILIDWTLDVPFRADIAVLAPDATSRLQRLHLEAGDEVIRQGEAGDTAYIIQSGRVEVLKNGRKVGELGGGEFFGEIALVSDTKRTATVRCLTACELTVLGRDDFQALSVGSSALARAIKQQIEERTGRRKARG